MNERISQVRLADDFNALGLKKGDVVLIRANLKAVGRLQGGVNAFLQALIDVVGSEGTVVSLSFSHSYFIRRADKNAPYTLQTPTYAGALPQGMIDFSGSIRSLHPTCSFVAIGRYAKEITAGHDAKTGAYEPVRQLINLGGQGVLVGCVGSSPGITTAHLAECDLGLHRRVIAPWLNSVYYIDDHQQLQLFRRRDHGLCSKSFSKFYSHYVSEGVLRAGLVGNAYSIVLPLSESYRIDRAILEKNTRFNICGDPDCAMCNARRWDQLHRLPLFVLRKVLKHIVGK